MEQAVNLNRRTRQRWAPHPETKNKTTNCLPIHRQVLTSEGSSFLVGFPFAEVGAFFVVVPVVGGGGVKFDGGGSRIPRVSVTVSQSLTPALPPPPDKVGAFGGPFRWFEPGSTRAAITVPDCGEARRYEDVSRASDEVRIMQVAEIGTNLVKLRRTCSGGGGELGAMADDD